ncbi:MAG: sensor histidine kinase, partial [Candidatus Bathyarchaeia archaeon]
VPILIQETLAKVKVSDDIKVDVQVEDNLLKLKTDPLFVKRILTNLITNAVQAMPNGGKITLKAALEGNEACISVEDTGEGIPDEVKSKLFKPLVTTKPRGQGFGLVVVKRLVEALGGKVTFESEVGKGTKFTVKLPA